MRLDDLTEEQRDLFNNISINLRDVGILETEIQKTCDSAKNGLLSFFGCNEADAPIISMRSQEKLNFLKEVGKEYLIQAVELGMQDLEVVQNNYENYVGKPLPINIGPELRESYRKMNLKFFP